MPHSVAIVTLGVRFTTRRSLGIARIVPLRALAPLDSDLETFHVEALQCVLGSFSIFFRFIFDESVGTLYKNVS